MLSATKVILRVINVLMLVMNQMHGQENLLVPPAVTLVHARPLTVFNVMFVPALKIVRQIIHIPPAQAPIQQNIRLPLPDKPRWAAELVINVPLLVPPAGHQEPVTAPVSREQASPHLFNVIKILPAQQVINLPLVQHLRV